jgi:hypothetical protein
MTSDPNEDERATSLRKAELSDFIAKYRIQLNEMGLLVMKQRAISEGHVHDSKITAVPDEILQPIALAVLNQQLRHTDPVHTVGLPEFIKASENAAEALHDLAAALENVHPYAYRELEERVLFDFKLSGRNIPKWFGLLPDYDRDDLLLDIIKLASRTKLYHIVSPTIEKNPVEKNNAGWSTSQYVMPAYELMKAWVRLTGSRAVSAKQPKGIKGSAAVQPSTEFVRIGLTIIDEHLTPKAALTKAITAIKEALKTENEARDLLAQQGKDGMRKFFGVE